MLYKVIKTNIKFKYSIYLIFIFSQLYSKVSDYRAVGLSSRQTIDTHPITCIEIFFLKTITLNKTVTCIFCFNFNTSVIIAQYLMLPKVYFDKSCYNLSQLSYNIFL